MFENDTIGKWYNYLHVCISKGKPPELSYIIESGERISFDSHEEIDYYCSYHIYEFQHKLSDSLLLKSFDRLFWLKMACQPNNTKFRPTADCQFGDPHTSASFPAQSDIISEPKPNSQSSCPSLWNWMGKALNAQTCVH